MEVLDRKGKFFPFEQKISLQNAMVTSLKIDSTPFWILHHPENDQSTN